MSMIQIRHVPEQIHKTLKLRAVNAGMSLSDYLLMEITKVAERPLLDDVIQRIQSRKSPSLRQSVKDAVREERHSR